MRLSNTHVNPDLPYWQDYVPFLQRLAGQDFPGCDQLNHLLPADLNTESGQSIRFVPSSQLAADAYEHRIYTTGQVSTRPNNWHDLFNALVWTRFPRIKLAMNTLHFHANSHHSGPGRGPQRDALTLFDECGGIVFSSRPALLQALANRHWQEVFVNSKATWGKEIQVSVSGHAMLEKFLSPYQSMTARVLLVQVDENYMNLPREEILKFLDSQIAAGMQAGRLLIKPAGLSPLPLTGIPGWWPDVEQDSRFYNNTQVFRPPPANLISAPIVKLN